MNDPSRIELCWCAAIKRPCGQNFFLFYYGHIFVKKSWKGFKGGPFEHTKTFFCKIFILFFVNIYEKCIFLPIQDFFLTKICMLLKNNCLFLRKVFKLQRLAKFGPILLETPYSGGVINPKTYLYHELGSKFFFLSSIN